MRVVVDEGASTHRVASTDRVFVALNDTSLLAETEQQPCQRIDAATLRAYSTAERSAFLSKPTLISGLIDDWPATEAWRTPEGVSASLGEHGVLCKRVMSSVACREIEARHPAMDPRSTVVRLSDLLAAGGSDVYTVIYNGEIGNAEAEEALLTAISASGMVRCPDLLGRACATTVFSLGGLTRGVDMANHGLAWIGLLAGLKLWYLAPPTVPRPATRPTCKRRDAIEVIDGATHCLQRPGDVIVVPGAWWHATCNLGPFTFGMGGQDSCDIRDCTSPREPGESESELHMRKVFCPEPSMAEACWGAPGLENARNHRIWQRAKWTLDEEVWAGDLAR